MAFIYTRATRVVAWLGHSKEDDTVRDWSNGATQHLGAHLSGQSKMQFSRSPDPKSFASMMDSAYWKRLWIVQELCLPRLLLFAYGAQIWTFEEFKRWVIPSVPQSESDAKQSLLAECDAASRLLESRDKRHTNMTRFENLIERFAKNECSEIRDRIYGLLECANDIRPFTGRDGEQSALSVYIDCLIYGVKPESQPQRGKGSLKVDYSCTLYDLWVSVVGFVYFQAFELPNDVVAHRFHTLGEILRLFPTVEETCATPPVERQISIVRTASIIQEALDQKVEAAERVCCQLGKSLIAQISPARY
jgi:hypothetical protein